jgi:hypothetical protein
MTSLGLILAVAYIDRMMSATAENAATADETSNIDALPQFWRC